MRGRVTFWNQPEGMGNPLETATDRLNEREVPMVGRDYMDRLTLQIGVQPGPKFLRGSTRRDLHKVFVNQDQLSTYPLHLVEAHTKLTEILLVVSATDVLGPA